MRNLKLKFAILSVLWTFLLTPIVQAQDPTFRETMSGIVDRLCRTLPVEKLVALDQQSAAQAITPEERVVLATRYWQFDVNVPVVVSVMRHTKQETVPFWLPEAGFTKTDLTVSNEEYDYEVWQKAFPAGHVGLGTNGFEKTREHYFVSVAPQTPGDVLELTNLAPSQFSVIEMKEGSLTYHDWPDLVLTKVPDSLKGGKLLTTIRGRAREGQLIGAFRVTPYPSSETPDQIMLTWTDDPRTTQTIQWRTSQTVKNGIVRYRESHSDGEAWTEATAVPAPIEDEFLVNDRIVNRYTATITNLKPDTSYAYMVGDPVTNKWSSPSDFRTGPGTQKPFSFVFLSDVHNKPETRTLLSDALQRYPQAAFCTISGDLVGTGQYRDDWDNLLNNLGDFAKLRPVAPAIGNHDAIDGLGADMYLGLFALPQNGSKAVKPETSYAFEYGNALFLILDATESSADQAPWLEEQLAKTKATWKFAVFHFPPYSPSEAYTDIQRDWVSLFDKYHVDFVFSGHVHYYLRTYPLKAGKRTQTPANGTIYLISVSVPGRERAPREIPEYADVLAFWGQPLYVAFTLDGKSALLETRDAQGNLRDSLTVEK